MSFSVTLPPPSVSAFPHPKQRSSYLENNFPLNFKFNLQQFQALSRLHLQTQVSRRTQNFPRDAPIDEPRNWLDPVDDEDEDEEDEDEDEDEDRSLDLLARFLQNVFKKISKRARKAVRSVLPVSIPTKLVGFSVNGVLLLAFLWVLKAFIEETWSLKLDVWMNAAFPVFCYLHPWKCSVCKHLTYSGDMDRGKLFTRKPQPEDK
ncbi:hypothetical protein ACB094_07G085300 [Castanea mollissima]